MDLNYDKIKLEEAATLMILSVRLVGLKSPLEFNFNPFPFGFHFVF
jgi:hypothetical protein